MIRRKLPRVIMRASDDMREAGLGTELQASYPTHLGEIAVAASQARASADNNVVVQKIVPEAASARRAGAVSPARNGSARRRTQALRIVNRHAGYSAVGGIIPLPVASFAGVTAVIVRMVKVLSDHYGVAFERDRARAIVVGLVAGAMPTGLATVTSSTLLYVVPASALVGLAVSSLSAVACTRGVGRIFVEHFESGATLVDFPAQSREAR
jgi:uncharacterized protein (DUF697 family)